MVKTVDLKRIPGAIPDAEAIDRVRVAIANARIERKKVVLIIHGYGSTGVGGSNREAIREYLNSEANSGNIRTVTPGEKLSTGYLKELQRRYSGHRFGELESHIRSGNPGVTLAEL